MKYFCIKQKYLTILVLMMISILVIGCQPKETLGIDSPMRIDEIDLQVMSVIKQDKLGEEYGMNVPGGVGLQDGYWLITEVYIANLKSMEKLTSLSSAVFLVDPNGSQEDVFMTKFASDEEDFPNAHVYWVFGVFNVKDDARQFELLLSDGQLINLNALLSP